MREWRQILTLADRGSPVALVTLVRLQGSSYRRVGARMLIAADGSYAGSISGGCLEAEVARKAAWLVRSGPVVIRYSTLFDDTADIPYGLGCGGTVDLLFEPAGTPEYFMVLDALRTAVAGQDQNVLTHLPEAGRPFSRQLILANTPLSPEAAGVPEPAGVPEAAGGHILAELLQAPQRLVVFGAGDDAQPVVQVASVLGWNVIVADGRPQFARDARFPGAAEVVLTQDVQVLQPGPRDAVVIMTHSFEQDRLWLTALLPLRLRYLGLLGARHRSALLVAEAAARLNWTVDRACEGLFAPVGLDLGGDGAEAIALAVVAEIQACCQGKLGASRRMNAALVAEQIAQGGASRYLQSQCAL